MERAWLALDDVAGGEWNVILESKFFIILKSCSEVYVVVEQEK